MTQFLFVTDLDCTLVGDDEALEVLNQHLSQHRLAHGTKIVYATGRSLASYGRLKAQKPLLEPDALVTSVGVEIYYPDSNTPDPQWAQTISQGWNRPAIAAIAAHFSALVPQPEMEQRPFKISFFLTEDAAVEVLPQLESLFQQRSLDAKLIYSGGKDLDILPRYADKGLAMQFLRSYYRIDAKRTVVCGDSGNDISMFSIGEERGIVVGNAQPELSRWHEANPSDRIYRALASCAGGILEGLKYFGFL